MSDHVYGGEIFAGEFIEQVHRGETKILPDDGITRGLGCLGVSMEIIVMLNCPETNNGLLANLPNPDQEEAMELKKIIMSDPRLSLENARMLITGGALFPRKRFTFANKEKQSINQATELSREAVVKAFDGSGISGFNNSSRDHWLDKGVMFGHIGFILGEEPRMISAKEAF